MKIIAVLLVLVINSLLLVWLLGGCGSNSSIQVPSHGSWSVSMSSVNTATLSVTNGLAAGQSIVSDGYNGTFSNSTGNLYIAAGATAGGPCQLLNPGLSTVIAAGATAMGFISLGENCTGALTSSLQIVLGNSTAGVADKNNNIIVAPGNVSICTIVPPGNSGSIGCTVNY